MRRELIRTAMVAIVMTGLSLTVPLSALSQIDSAGSDHLTTIGELEGPKGLIFGHIVDAELASGRVYILDSHYGQLRVFSHGGRHIETVGRRGRGPGELFLPRALEVGSGGDEIYVLDSGNLRVQSFVFEGDSLKTGEFEFRLPFEAFDMCRLGDEFYFVGWYEGSLVHRFSKRGDYLDSFGEPLLNSHPVLSTVDGAYIKCLSELERVLLAGQKVPVIRAYGPSGNVLWKHQLRGLDRIRISATASGGRDFDSPESGKHPEYITSLEYLPPIGVLVQYGRVVPTEPNVEAITAVRSVFFDPNSGTEVKRSSVLPRVDAVSQARILSHPSLPFPRCILRPTNRIVTQVR